MGERADSLNFFEVSPSSFRENHLGKKKNHFFLSLPTHSCDVVCAGRSGHGSHTGEKLHYLLWPGSHTSQLGKSETSGKMSQEKAETSISNSPQSCCETSHQCLPLSR